MTGHEIIGGFADLNDGLACGRKDLIQEADISSDITAAFKYGGDVLNPRQHFLPAFGTQFLVK